MEVKDESPAVSGGRNGRDQGAAGRHDQLEAKNKSKAAAGTGQKPNPKDPSRPRRKKARRACFACQRAHLTCGKLTSYLPACIFLSVPCFAWLRISAGICIVLGLPWGDS